MRVGWVLVAILWLVPAASMLACPFDLHGFSSCSVAAQAGRTVSFYIVAPGLWLGSALSDALSEPGSGASGAAFAVGIVLWLVALSAITLWAARWVTRRPVAEA